MSHRDYLPGAAARHPGRADQHRLGEQRPADSVTGPGEPVRADTDRGVDGDGPTRRETDLGAAVAALTGDTLESVQRKRLLSQLVGEIRARGVTDLFKPRAVIRWLTDVLNDIAPYVPIRDRYTLRSHFPGLDDEELADRLIRNAARVTAGIGAAGGGVAAVEWAATPTLLSAPVLLVAETVAVVAVELKLIGELHEVYRVPIPGNAAQRAVTLVRSWADQRGVTPLVPGAVLGTAARRELREALLKRFSRNLTTLGPFLTGAAAAGYLNRRATRALGGQLRDDLRRQRHTDIRSGRAAIDSGGAEPDGRTP